MLTPAGEGQLYKEQLLLAWCYTASPDGANLRFSNKIRLSDRVNLRVVGYFRFGVRLLNIKATASKIRQPVNTGESTKRNPRAFIFSEPITAINAVAPPGGCRVLVSCMATIEIETAKGAVSQMISGS